MKKILKNSWAFIFSLVLFGLAFFYLKFQESDYDSLMKQAYKRKNEFSAFMVFDGKFEPAIPDKDKNVKDHLGLDSDSNDIRDDIDIWIGRMGYNFNERMAMRQYAKALQVFQKYCQENNTSQLVKDSEYLNESRICLSMITDYSRGEGSSTIKALNILTSNTDLRKTCYNPDNGIKEEKEVSVEWLKTNCHFEIQNAKGIVEVSEILKKKK